MATKVGTAGVSPARGSACGGWVAGDRADLARRRDFEDLEVVRGAQFVVLETARYVDRVAGAEAEHLTALEFELDPAVQHIDELVFADMVMPTGRLGHAGLGLGQLGAHLAAAGGFDGEIAISEEIAAAFDHHRVFRGGMTDLRGRLLGYGCDVVRHGDLLRVSPVGTS